MKKKLISARTSISVKKSQLEIEDYLKKMGATDCELYDDGFSFTMGIYHHEVPVTAFNDDQENRTEWRRAFNTVMHKYQSCLTGIEEPETAWVGYRVVSDASTGTSEEGIPAEAILRKLYAVLRDAGVANGAA